MFEDLAVRRREYQEQLDAGTDESSFEARIMKSIREIDKVLGDSDEIDDPMWDLWESQLAAGETPDL